MNKPFIIGLALISSLSLTCCALNPAWVFNPHEFDYDTQRQKLTDTPRNRQLYLGEYKRLIDREAMGADAPWPTVWKGILESIGESMDNPQLYKSYIVQQRRARGLPELTLHTTN